MSDTDETRQQGVEFGEFEETMESLDYPIDNSDVVSEHGDAEIELPNGTTTVGDVSATSPTGTSRPVRRHRDTLSWNMIRRT